MEIIIVIILMILSYLFGVGLMLKSVCDTYGLHMETVRNDIKTHIMETRSGRA